jgi:hypothetical protein
VGSLLIRGPSTRGCKLPTASNCGSISPAKQFSSRACKRNEPGAKRETFSIFEATIGNGRRAKFLIGHHRPHWMHHSHWCSEGRITTSPIVHLGSRFKSGDSQSYLCGERLGVPPIREKEHWRNQNIAQDNVLLKMNYCSRGSCAQRCRKATNWSVNKGLHWVTAIIVLRSSPWRHREPAINHEVL